MAVVAALALIGPAVAQGPGIFGTPAGGPAGAFGDSSLSLGTPLGDVSWFGPYGIFGPTDIFGPLGLFGNSGLYGTRGQFFPALTYTGWWNGYGLG